MLQDGNLLARCPLVSPFATRSNCLPLHLHTVQQVPYQHVHTHTQQALQIDLTRRVAKTNGKKKKMLSKSEKVTCRTQKSKGRSKTANAKAFFKLANHA